MTGRNRLSLSALLAWLLLFGWASPAAAQIRAMPPIVATADGLSPNYDTASVRYYGPGLPTSVVPTQYQQPTQHQQPTQYEQLPAGGLPWNPPPAQDATGFLPQPPGQSMVGVGQPFPSGECWSWHVLPEGLLYKSYLAGGRESRLASKTVYERELGWLWDIALGGRVGLLRYGNGEIAYPEGWQLDLEGAAFPRLDFEHGHDLVSADYRVGVPLTVREGRWEGKLAYYHLSSHLGDEYMVRYPAATRINYVRDAFALGVALRPVPDVRLYSEAGWAFHTDGGSRPWEFQFGVDYSPAEPLGGAPAPFVAFNGRIREELDYGGNFTVETGVQWRGHSGDLLRFGMHYFNGMSDQYQFFRTHEELLGLGLWYDY
ncbi:MAG: DUF1207 domain-containing protein [Pirellulales bacterium]|nr:DUF1207 domain-containing protein [Pirellulales bacterium]